jgi:diphosphomevalonate decarboxylase
MHGTTLAATPPFTYWSAESMKVMNLVRQIRNGGLPCYFTMDAGPNVKLLVERKNEAALLSAMSAHLDAKQLVVAHAGPAIEILSKEDA